ncbi:acyltransferase [Thalassotalea agarivorans]|uniref:1-acyl-sn-glycerol-3-phosphate acyltransferases n=1 Tax=Thalassotalea agarivorans TaxID=349064 RepID=A0A1I0CQN5_THASX|nr:acyltransferase [Thalassotalea agarivorans]SET21605.1 1-acyl-sn-glycerol-3-phosphate acyltransferases [Thalassotalea agarivorans]
MLSFLPAPITLILSFTCYAINTLFWLLPILIGSFLKALIPLNAWQSLFSYLLDAMASSWVAINSQIQNLFYKMKVNVTGLDQLTPKDWYMVVSNHQSWVDIVVLQRILHGKIPFLKFFLKKELIYVPFLGVAWWALDFPFMKRYSQSFLKKNPHLIGKDFETTKKACAKFKHKPVSVMNFVEGTRYTPEKHDRQKSPFSHLLRPKAGGMAFVLDAMGEHLNKIVNVTIHYPEKIPNFIDFLSGKVKQVNVYIETLPITDALMGDYANDKAHKKQFQKWLNELWQEKDRRIALFEDAK